MTILLTAILTLIALFHLAWGFNIWIPIRDEAALTRAVVGAKDVTRMPGTIPCVLVVAGLLIVILAMWFPQFAAARLVLWAGAVVFILRGAIAYTATCRPMTPQEPFATLDPRIHTPLCFPLRAGLLFTIFGG